jgi:hypothetical protein
MAFEINKFTSVNAQGYGEGLMNEWKYVTTDPEAALGVGDYFKDVQKSLAVGDLIRVYFFSRIVGMVATTRGIEYSVSGCRTVKESMWQRWELLPWTVRGC